MSPAIFYFKTPPYTYRYHSKREKRGKTRAGLEESVVFSPDFGTGRECVKLALLSSNYCYCSLCKIDYCGLKANVQPQIQGEGTELVSWWFILQLLCISSVYMLISTQTHE